MGFDPNLVLYACVAKDTIVLAEFNAKDHQDLGLLALKCLAKTPLFHITFSHTIRGKTYTFLMQEPFTYFTICDERLENVHVLAFLESVKLAFDDVGDKSWSKKRIDKLGSHCFQGEFNPVFHQLLSVSGGEQMGMKLFHHRNGSMDYGRGSVPLLEGHGLMKKRKNMTFLNDMFSMRKNIDGGCERKVDVCDDDHDHEKRGVSMNNVLLRDAKKSWKKHVWVVLTLDLIICLILFSVWLWVCRGLKCIDG